MTLALTNLAANTIPDGTFMFYIAALAVAGLVLVVLAAINLGGQSPVMRILNAVIGLGFLGYAFYLFFLFNGGTFRLFYYPFILPVLLVIQAVRNRKNRAAAR
ncbi:hypothetical protein [Caballeronia mineralivorans]|jgi:phosphotransferase system  glucose/maltose/N-acetylglucosamine-specific IIC component|uniref:hypothetical protein n=1 Tax=Caballeronia mineralivorans TaxID=2010198 RepID=UPI0023F46CC1|nr:hypothetical protein [Caballeronia mineralivorans]MDB5788532.1 hypothetical protein [Caballeronia mineralivorans]